MPSTGVAFVLVIFWPPRRAGLVRGRTVDGGHVDVDAVVELAAAGESKVGPVAPGIGVAVDEPLVRGT